MCPSIRLVPTSAPKLPVVCLTNQSLVSVDQVGADVGTIGLACDSEQWQDVSVDQVGADVGTKMVLSRLAETGHVSVDQVGADVGTRPARRTKR